jgi:hypothetical protein
VKRPISKGKTWLYSIITFLIAILITYSLLTRYYLTDERQFGLQDDVYTRALDRAAGQAGPDDRIVTVAPSHYHVPMNHFKARIPLIGFAQQRPPLPDAALPLLQDALQGQNAWLVTVGFTPAAADNAAEQWLAFHAFKASDEWLGDTRLVRYGVEGPTTMRSINARLGQELELESVRLPQAPARGRVLAVEFTWVPLQRPRADYNLFLQLLAADGRPVAQHDGPPGGGYLPTSNWSPGQSIADRHGLALPADLPAGSYRLIAGMVDPGSGQRLAAQSVPGGDFVDLGTVVIP